MPKTRERSVSSKSASAAVAKPYDRTRSKSSSSAMPSSAPVVNGVSSTAASKSATASQPDVAAPVKAQNGTSRRRNKKRKSQTRIAPEADGADTVSAAPADEVAAESEAEIQSRSPSPEPVVRSKRTKVETASDIIDRHKANIPSASNAVQEALTSEKAEHVETRRQLRDTQSKLRVSEDKAAKAAKELTRRVEHLEKELKKRENEVVEQTAEIANQTKVRYAKWPS